MKLKQGHKTESSKRKREIMPEEVRHLFPDCLVLGPQQLEIINSDRNRILIVGDVGTGKSLVLLALLYKHTAKCLSILDNPGYQKVLFLVPKNRVEFRKYVERFITDYCNREYIFFPQDPGLVDQSFIPKNNIKIILLDETIDDGDLFIRSKFNLSLIDQEIKIYRTALLTFHNSLFDTYHGKEQTAWSEFVLHQVYRCPVNVARRSSAIRRDVSFYPNRSLLLYTAFFGLPLSYGVSVMQEDSIEVKEISSLEEIAHVIPGKRVKNEQMLAVVYRYKGTEQQLKIALESYECVADIDDFKKFSGVQYPTVVFISARIEPEWLFDDTFFRQRKLWKTKFFHVMNRTTGRLVIICHKDNYRFFNDLLSLNELDIRVFAKLRRKQRVDPKDYMLLQTREELMEFLKILLQTNNFKQYKEMQKETSGKVDYRFFIDVFHGFISNHYDFSEKILIKIFQFLKDAGDWRTMRQVVCDPVVLHFLLDLECTDLASLLQPPCFNIPEISEWYILASIMTVSVYLSDETMFQDSVLQALKLSTILHEEFDQLVNSVHSNLSPNFEWRNQKFVNVLDPKEASIILESKLTPVKQFEECCKLLNPFKCQNITRSLRDKNKVAKCLEIGFNDVLLTKFDPYDRTYDELSDSCCNLLEVEKEFFRALWLPARKRADSHFSTDAQREAVQTMKEMIEIILKQM